MVNGNDRNQLAEMIKELNKNIETLLKRSYWEFVDTYGEDPGVRDDSKNVVKNSRTDKNAAISCPVTFSPNSTYIIGGGTVFLVPRFEYYKTRVFFVQYDDHAQVLKFWFTSKVVDLDGKPVDRSIKEINIKENGDKYFIEMGGISIMSRLNLNGDKSPVIMSVPIENRLTLNEFFNKFTHNHTSFIYYHPSDLEFMEYHPSEEALPNGSFFSNQLYRGTMFGRLSPIMSCRGRSFFVKRCVSDNGDPYISLYCITDVSLPNGTINEVSIKFDEHHIIYANSGDNTVKMKMEVGQNMMFCENDFNEFIKDKSFFVV